MREFDVCPCCHYEKQTTEWHFNFEKGIKVCDDCYNAMRICEKDLFEKGTADEIFCDPCRRLCESGFVKQVKQQVILVTDIGC